MAARGTPRHRRILGALASLCLTAGLVGCDAAGDEPRPDRPEAEQRASTSDSTSDGPTGGQRRLSADRKPDVAPLAGLPQSPPARNAARLARHLVQVERVLQDRTSSAADVRRAAEFEQLAGRMLGRGPDAYASRVLGELPPPVRRKTRAHVEAAGLLDSLGGPVSSFPDWRIVEPPRAKVLLHHYRSAGRQVGVPWEYLAAVHLVETRMGRISGVSTAGARGPMQFLPTTWDIYGRGGDITDPRDAIFAAARLLRANGAPGDMSRALWHYNPSSYYVGAVTRYARQIERSTTAYRGYWHWRVLYEHVAGTVVLPVGYPEVRPRRLR